MKQALLTALLALGAAAAVGPLPLVPTAPSPEAPTRYPRLRPIPFFWNELDAQRVNQGALGRKNATRDEQRVAETPSLSPRPLSSW